MLNPNLTKGPWTDDEDRLVVELVEKHGAKKWSLIAQNLPGRIGKQCRERWYVLKKRGGLRGLQRGLRRGASLHVLSLVSCGAVYVM